MKLIKIASIVLVVNAVVTYLRKKINNSACGWAIERWQLGYVKRCKHSVCVGGAGVCVCVMAYIGSNFVEK